MKEIIPVLVPNTTTILFSSSFRLEEITLCNKSAAAVTVTVADMQSPPLEVLAAVSIEANATYVIRFGGRSCPGGLTWVASAASAVVGSVSGY